MKSILKIAMVVTAVACVAIMPLSAGMELILHDGTVLEGVDLKRVEGNYVLTQEDGETVTLPVELVDTVRLTGQGETLVGETVRPPQRTEQLKVLGPPSSLQPDAVDNSWRPSTDWAMDPDIQNNFAPSTWREDLIESVWLPQSSWEMKRDVLASGRTTWRKSIIDSSWSPTDGFGGSARFP